MLMKKEFMVGIALDKTLVSVSVCFSTLKMILLILQVVRRRELGPPGRRYDAAIATKSQRGQEA
uniref:Uncharacterized protein n=1 Tax=Oryza barthii TaxID=65489 RepID=A0A0D3GYK8_9ORYZ